MEAREWFYTHVEARFARRYELWTDEEGCIKSSILEGDYKYILNRIIQEGMPYPLISPVFSKAELVRFYQQFEEEKYGFDKKDLLEILKQNINWQIG